MSAHPLETYIYETFGQQFGDLLMAGYGAEPGSGPLKLHLTETMAEKEMRWVIELVSPSLPRGDEPLVLAALLKLLLSRRSISQRMEFEMSELLAELGCEDDASTREGVESVIINYARLVYDKRADTRAGGYTPATEEGCYHLLGSYLRGGESAAGEAPARRFRGVEFDPLFTARLREGRVYFAGIDFGELNANRRGNTSIGNDLYPRLK